MLAAGWSSPPPSGTQALVSRQADGPDTQHAGAEQPCSLRLAAVGAGGHPSSHVHTREWRALCTRSDLRARTTQPHGCGAPRSPVMHDSISPTRSPQPGAPALWAACTTPPPAPAADEASCPERTQTGTGLFWRRMGRGGLASCWRRRPAHKRLSNVAEAWGRGSQDASTGPVVVLRCRPSGRGLGQRMGKEGPGRGAQPAVIAVARADARSALRAAGATS